MYSRELVIVDYGDEFTKGQLEQKKEKTLALIKPDAFLKVSVLGVSREVSVAATFVI